VPLTTSAWSPAAWLSQYAFSYGLSVASRSVTWYCRAMSAREASIVRRPIYAREAAGASATREKLRCHLASTSPPSVDRTVKS
jgi:hypothetical protein